MPEVIRFKHVETEQKDTLPWCEKCHVFHTKETHKIIEDSWKK